LSEETNETIEAPAVTEPTPDTEAVEAAPATPETPKAETAAPEAVVDAPAEALVEAAVETAAAAESKADGDASAEADPAAAEKAATEKAAAEKARQARIAPLYRAFRAKRSMNGRVEGLIKGGFEIRLGKVRAFCPHSQIDVVRVEEPESFVGKSFAFRITQLRRGGDDVVVSRRALVEDERREEAGAVRATLIEGAVMLGRISGLAKFGAFVDLGAGVTGLVHLTELSHGRVARAEQAVQAGEAVRVKILKLEDDNKRISLSIRQASEDPWASVENSFKEGESYPGKLLRIADFGAFIELSPGVEALAPASEFPPSRLGWADGLELGSEGRWQVLNVDSGRRRISVTLAPAEGAAAAIQVAAGASIRGKVQRIERYGVFIWLGPGKVGLMPNALSGTRPGTDLARQFPIAEEIEVDVLDVDDAGRIRLAAKGQGEKAAARRPQDRPGRGDRPRRKKERLPDGPPASDSSEGFGSQLADKLKDALG